MWRTATGFWEWLGWRKLFLFGGFWTGALPFAAYLITHGLGLLGVPIGISTFAYVVLAIAGLFGFLLVHLFRRLHETEILIEPKLHLGFDKAKCIRDVHFPYGGMSRFVSVTVSGQEHISIPDTCVYLHSVELICEDGSIERVDIEGSPPLEWAQSPGHVVAYDPRTLHSGRESLINVLRCTDKPYPADIYICSPQLLIREGGAMGIEGIYKVTVRASGEGTGKFAEVVLKIIWDGVDVKSLRAEVWQPGNI
ncbi:MAG: hypothetical protein WD793_06505 [Steroidobacteraceae bacterium]